MSTNEYDVVVVGAGNAALCAAIAARENNARVLVLERAPESEKGGNSYFTAGGFRFAHDGLDDVCKDILIDLSDTERGQIVLPSHTRPPARAWRRPRPSAARRRSRSRRSR